VALLAYRDPDAFHAVAGAWLARDPVRHNLMLGLLATLRERPEVYPDFALWLVREEGEAVAAALRTRPHPLVLAAPEAQAATLELADGLRSLEEHLPGVVGALPEAEVFAARYLEGSGSRIVRRMEQAIHVLETVEDVPTPSGGVRVAGRADLDLVLEWMRAFHAEALGPHDADENEARRRVLPRLEREEGGGLRFWMAGGEPVCLAGFVEGGIAASRIGPVYTPPAHRRRGYATALVANISRERLDAGASFCLLYTDLANPTSNAIYRRIGYRRTCDAAMLSFG
jgi:predicted GNAT family acetyltransferase